MRFSQLSTFVAEQQKRFAPDPRAALLTTLSDLQLLAGKITELSEAPEPVSAIKDFFSLMRTWQDDRLSSLEKDFVKADLRGRYTNIICAIQDVRRNVRSAMESGYVLWRPQNEMISVADAIYLGAVSGIARKPISAFVEKETDVKTWLAISSQAQHFMQIHARMLRRSIGDLVAAADIR